MRCLFRQAAFFGLLISLPSVCLLAVHRAAAQSDDSAAQDVSPTPVHVHKRHHARKSSTASPAPEDETAATPKPEGEAEPAEPGPSAAEESGVASATPKPRPSMAPDASLDADQLEDFAAQPAKVRSLIASALDLTRRNLTYTYASDDPANGGLDCSGFVYYVLTKAGLEDVPRDASGQYSWVRKANNFQAVISRRLDGFELDALKPGDLLFWSGTYKTDRDPPVTHTMIYLGREKETGDRVMVGSADGRSYHGLQRWGVSVFDFKPVPASSPAPGGNQPRFIGYGAIPGF